MLTNELYGWIEVPNIKIMRNNYPITEFKTIIDFTEKYEENCWNVIFNSALITPWIIDEITNDNSDLWLYCSAPFRSKETGKDEKMTLIYGPGYLEKYEAGTKANGDPAQYNLIFKLMKRRIE